jgi:hypothetical protein
MIERMKAPMQSMGIAFSASMFGLLGSIILGLMMVGIRRLQGDIFSLLGSEIARHIEIALAHEELHVGNERKNGAVNSRDESRILTRIEERLAEAVRFQQRILASEIEDFQKQRAEMLRTLTEQNEASNINCSSGSSSVLCRAGEQQPDMWTGFRSDRSYVCRGKGVAYTACHADG